MKSNKHSNLIGIHDLVEANEERIEKALAKAVVRALEAKKPTKVIVEVKMTPDEKRPDVLEVGVHVKAKLPVLEVKLLAFGGASGALTRESDDLLSPATKAAQEFVDGIRNNDGLDSVSIGVPGQEPIVIRGGRKPRPSGAKLN